MKRAKKCILMVLLLFSGVYFSSAHPYYLSLCLIDFNQQEQSLEISVKIFTDDLILALSEQGHDKLFLGEEKEDPQAKEYICNYIKQKLNFRINTNEVQLNFVGKENEKDVVWTYFIINNVKSLNEFEVECNLLTDVIENQSNVVQVNNSIETKSLLLNAEKTKGYIIF